MQKRRKEEDKKLHAAECVKDKTAKDTHTKNYTNETDGNINQRRKTKNKIPNEKFK